MPTKKEMYAAIADFVASTPSATADFVAEVRSFCENEIRQLSCRTDRERERARSKTADDPIIDLVRDALTLEWMSLSDVASAIGREDITVGMITARLTKLFALGEIDKATMAIDPPEPGLKIRYVMAYRKLSEKEKELIERRC